MLYAFLLGFAFVFLNVWILFFVVLFLGFGHNMQQQPHFGIWI